MPHQNSKKFMENWQNLASSIHDSVNPPFKKGLEIPGPNTKQSLLKYPSLVYRITLRNSTSLSLFFLKGKEFVFFFALGI